MARKSRATDIAFQSGQRQACTVMKKKTRVVMSIVPVTAMPYAAASLLECWNPSTSAMQATIRNWFTPGR